MVEECKFIFEVILFLVLYKVKPSRAQIKGVCVCVCVFSLHSSSLNRHASLALIISSYY